MKLLIVCGTCNKRLTHDKFAESNSDTETGGEYTCRSCVAKRARDCYGITTEEWGLMFSEQDGKCAICSGDYSTGRRLAVDHCHTSGAVRGLLCAQCSQGLENFNNDTDRIKQAIEYLGRTQTWPSMDQPYQSLKKYTQ